MSLSSRASTIASRAEQTDADGRPDLVSVPAREPSSRVLHRFVSGDAEALGEIFDHYSRSVWSVAMRVLQQERLADDAVQETFLRLWRTADRFDPKRPLSPWLFTIARRTAIDVLRREMRPTRGAHEEEQDVVVELPGIEQSWERWEIVNALQALPEDERIVVRMSHLEGLTHNQIAERLGVPAGTVKSRSHRAHRRLAAMLRHLVHDDADTREGRTHHGS